MSEADSSNLQVLEKETRTVYIDGAAGGHTAPQQPKSTRNVGILCKTAMREVGGIVVVAAAVVVVVVVAVDFSRIVIHFRSAT